MHKIIYSAIIVSFMLFSAIAAALPLPIQGMSILGGKQITIGASPKKGLVVVFLSAVCPCSNSHLSELKNLNAAFPEFEFVGVHSNTDEEKELTTSYFRSAKLPFPIIQDTGAKLADEFKALKTPHAFVILNDGSVVYQGGVSSSRNFENADRKYLREALEDISTGKKVNTPQGRTLGCIIARGGNHVW